MPSVFINGKFGASNDINDTQYSAGAFLVSTDTEQLFIDLNNKRIPIDSIVSGKTESQIRALTSAQRLPKIYLASDNKKLLYYDSTEADWITIADPNGGGSGGTATNVVETQATANADREILVANADKDAVEYTSNVKINASTGKLTANSVKLGDATVSFNSTSESLVFDFT